MVPVFVACVCVRAAGRRTDADLHHSLFIPVAPFVWSVQRVCVRTSEVKFCPSHFIHVVASFNSNNLSCQPFVASFPYRLNLHQPRSLHYVILVTYATLFRDHFQFHVPEERHKKVNNRENDNIVSSPRLLSFFKTFQSIVSSILYALYASFCRRTAL